jgi:hypothetical protein
MKSKNFSAILSLLIALALIITAFLPAISVSADSAYLEMSRKAGSAGEMFDVRGYDFSKGDYYYVFFGEKYCGGGVVDEEGEFIESISVPDDVENQIYLITAGTSLDDLNGPDLDYDFDETVTADFEVKDIEIKLKSISGTISNPIEISGTGFSKDYNYYIFFDETYRATGTVESNGTFTRSIPTPSKQSGFYEIAVMASQSRNGSPSYTDDYDESAVIQFEIVVEAALGIDDNSGYVGDTFNLTGSFFGAGKKVTVYWDETKIGDTFSASSGGTFEDAAYKVPETPFGTHTVKAVDSSRTFGAVSYTVNPRFMISSTSITGGVPFEVSCTGFKGSSSLTFFVGDTALKTTANTSALGSLSSASLTISNVSSGSYIFKAQDASGNSASVNINITGSTSVTTPTPTVTSTPTQTTSIPTTSTTSTVPVSTTTVTQTTTATQTTTTPQPSPTPSTFPVWAIVIIIITIILILVVILIVSRIRK